MRVALYGGSFNPPHVVHQMIMLYVLETQGVDELWMIPTYRHAFGKELVSFEHRLAMCRRLCEPFGSRLRCSEIERELGGESRTIDTLLALKERHPENQWSWVLGSDIRAETHRWKNFSALEEQARMIWIGRQNQVEDKTRDEMIFPDVSSSEIRSKLNEGYSVGSLVPARILEYIQEQILYKTM